MLGFFQSPLILAVNSRPQERKNGQPECTAGRARAHYSFLGTFVMMGLGRILKINLRLMKAVTE